MKVYATLWRVGFQDAIQYRIEGFIWFLFDVVPPLMMLAFWSAAYENTAEVAGYSLSAMLTYTIGVMVLRNVIASHVEWEVDYNVRQGILSNYLVKPVPTWAFWLMNDSAWRTWRGVMVSPLMIVAVLVFLPSLDAPPLSLGSLAALVPSLVLAYALCFVLKLTLGFTSFWLTEVTGVTLLYEIVVYLFGGILIPLELLPEVLQVAARSMPFQYIYAFPLGVILGRIEGQALINGLLAQLGWLIALLVLARFTWQAGLRRYEAVGG